MQPPPAGVTSTSPPSTPSSITTRSSASIQAPAFSPYSTDTPSIALRRSPRGTPRAFTPGGHHIISAYHAAPPYSPVLTPTASSARSIPSAASAATLTPKPSSTRSGFAGSPKSPHPRGIGKMPGGHHIISAYHTAPPYSPVLTPTASSARSVTSAASAATLTPKPSSTRSGFE